MRLSPERNTPDAKQPPFWEVWRGRTRFTPHSRVSSRRSLRMLSGDSDPDSARLCKFSWKQVGDFLQIAGKLRSGFLSFVAVRCAQDGCRMSCCHHVRRKLRRNEFSPIASHAEFFSEECLGRTGSETNQHFRLHDFQLGVEPGAAGLDFRMPRLLVNASLASLRRLPFEVFDHVGHVYFRAVDADLDQNFVEQSSGWSDKWVAGPIFVVSRLLSYEHHASFGRTLSKHGLRSKLPQIASLASL